MTVSICAWTNLCSCQRILSGRLYQYLLPSEEMVGWSDFGFRISARNPGGIESSHTDLKSDAYKILNFADFNDLIKPLSPCKILLPTSSIKMLVTNSLRLPHRIKSYHYTVALF
jgi:hypothetical protein